ncbi:MAG: mannose-6-phosphate isomerase [Ruminococcaceae bacterium]|nr:mannose-6-phosphate isomerase [Oscillospiraceae bacterium]
MFPIVTKPIFKTAVWAGKKLSEYYGVDYSVSEAWMLSVRPNDNSQAVNEPYAGKTLGEIEEYRDASENFPLLIKLIDANTPLSVQVHPDDEYAHKKGEPYGKTEMWYIVEAQPGAQLVYGLKKGADSEALAKAVKDGKTADVLNYVDVKAGECYFIPAGMVHAIGAGILIAEIQQNSDTTYRLYDYDRVDKDGNKRQLHIEDALACTKPNAVSTYECTAPVIAKCDFFTTEKHSLKGAAGFDGREMTHILVLDGIGKIKYGEYTHSIEKYSSILAPKGCGEFILEGDFEVLVTRA